MTTEILTFKTPLTQTLPSIFSGTDGESFITGRHISLSNDGKIVAVVEFNTNDNKQYVRVYKYTSNNVWIKTGIIDSSLQYFDDVILSGDGTMLFLYHLGSNKKQVYKDIDNDWQLIKEFTIVSVVSDKFVDSMSEDGKTIAIQTGINYTTVYNYDLSDNVWNQLGNDISINELIKTSLSSDGKIIAILNNEKVSIFKYIDPSWVNIGEINYPNLKSVSLSSNGNIIAIGSQDFVKVYRYTGSSWEMLGNSIGSYSGIGNTVILSGDGLKLIYGDRSSIEVRYFDGNNWSGHKTISTVLDGRNITGLENVYESMKLSRNGSLIAFNTYGYNTDESNDLDLVSFYSIIQPLYILTTDKIDDISKNINEISYVQEASSIYLDLSNQDLLTSGTSNEQKFKRNEFIKQLLEKNKEVLKDTSKKFVMRTEDFLTNDVITKSRIKIIDNFDSLGNKQLNTEYNTTDLSENEAIYIPLESVGESIILTTISSNKIKFEKISDTSYNVYEGYVDNTSNVTKVMSEGESGYYNNEFKYIIGSVAGENAPLEILSMTMDDIISPEYTKTLNIEFNEHVIEASLNQYITIDPSYIGSLSPLTSTDEGKTYTGTFTRTSEMNKLNNNISITYNGLTKDVSFNVINDPDIYNHESGTLGRKVLSMTMSNSNIKYPETSSTFEVKFATNELSKTDVDENISFEPQNINDISAGSITDTNLTNYGFTYTGVFQLNDELSDEISTTMDLVYNETETGIEETLNFSISTYKTAYSNICFYENAKVLTDNGYKEIKDVKRGMKIQGKKIEEITQTYTEEENVVLMKAGSIMKNMPIEDTRITKEHKILYKGKMIKSKNLVNGKSIVYEKYNGNILYNILLEGDEENKMVVNGMIVETLSPKNNIAQLYKYILRKFKTKEEKNEIIKIFNEEKKGTKLKNNNK